MAYNNGFPTGYYYPQYQQPQNNSGIIWVQGIAGAKSYLVAPNNTVQLWDSESQTIYLKSADASGMPSMKVLDYTVRPSESAPERVIGATPTVPTQDDIKALQAQIDDLKTRLEGMINE